MKHGIIYMYIGILIWYVQVLHIFQGEKGEKKILPVYTVHV